MAVFVRDSFTNSRGISATAHTGEVGATWILHPATSTAVTLDGGGLIGGKAIPSGTPSSAEYRVDYDLLEVGPDGSSCFVRQDPVTTDAYVLFYNSGAGNVKIARQGTSYYTSPSYAKPATYPGRTHISLSVEDEATGVLLKAYIDGVEVLNWLDTNANRITAAGVPSINPGGARFDCIVENFTARDLDTADSIEIAELPPKKVLQRNTSSESTSTEFRGTYSGSAPTGIEVQILDAADGTTVIQDWTATTSATILNGFWKGSVSVPNGGWYIAKARQANNTSLVAAQANKWGVGIVVIAAGQSNMDSIFAGTGGTKDALLTEYNVSVSGYGVCDKPMHTAACALGNALVSKTGLPVMFYEYAVAGSALLDIGTTGWANPSYSASISAEKWSAFTGQAEFFIWSQGESEAYYSGGFVTTAEYIAGFNTLAARISARYPGIKFVIQPLGMCQGTAYDDDKFNAIRWAHIDLAESSTSDDYLSGPAVNNLPATGSVHFDNYSDLGLRWAEALAHYAGGTSSGIGATIIGYVPVSGNTVFDVKISHDEGTDFTPTTGINGFEVFDGSTPIPITSAARQSSDAIRLTLDTAVASPSIYYVYGVNQAATNYVVDNTAATLPLRPYSGALELAIVDATAPAITDATATATGPTTATASVTTDDGNGTLYFLASENATEPAATVKAALSQSVTVAGAQSISLSALDPGTTYYVHFVQINGAGLESASVVTTNSITTQAVPPVVYPVISATTAASSTSAVSATITTDTAGGTIYGVLSTSATVMTAADIKSGADDSATVTDAGDYTLNETGLATWTQYYWHIVHEDADGLMSNVLTIPVRTLDISIPLAFSDTAPATLLGVQVWSRLPKKAEVEGLY